MIKRFIDEHGVTTVYVCLLPCFRLKFRDGKYDSWYNPRLKKVV